jgi:multidrug efflux pump subunit AcrA (membrane-fusion protein)
MRRRAILAGLGAGLAILIAGCGGSSATEPAAGPDPQPSTSQATPAAAPVEVTVEGATVTPNGKRVEAAVGEPVTVRVTSDRAGELHVHATPEQTLPFGNGRTTVQITIDQPGLVDVEEHEADLVVLQLQVS